MVHLLQPFSNLILHRLTRLTRHLATHDPDVFIDEHQDIADLLQRPAFQRVGRAVVLTGRGAGILSITDVQRALRAFDLRSDQSLNNPVGGPRHVPVD